MFSLLIGLLLSSCTGNTLYHHFQSLPAEGWERSDTVCFDVPKAEEDMEGTLFVAFRTTAYPGIREVVLAVEQCGEDAAVFRCDTIRCTLADDEGNATVQGVNYHQYEDWPLPFSLQKDKSQSIRIHHLMRSEVISGISEVGIRIEKR